VCAFKGILRIKATSPGVVVIEGTEAGLYLSMNEDGKLYASVSIKKPFGYKEMHQHLHNYYMCFSVSAVASNG